MYEAYYGLREKPFSILPDPDLIYWGQAHRLAYSMLEFGVMNNSLITVITGEIGSGKTTLVRHLLRKLNPKTTNVGLLTHTPERLEDLLPGIMLALNLPFEGTITGLLKTLQDFLYAQRKAGRQTILVVDEAQNLGERALEGLRMLSNINVGKDQFVQLVLVGQPQLKDMLRQPQLLQFAQRVSSDFHLRPLVRDEVAQYIDFRLAAVGARVQLFSDEACAQIADSSLGIPRVINILCDTALVYGFSAGVSHISGKLIADVIEDKRNHGIFPMDHYLVRSP